MSLTVWANHEFCAGARELFYDSLARLGCRVIQSDKSSASNLAAGGPDPTLAEADIAYGQPDPADVTGYPRLRWLALSTAGYTRYDGESFRAAMRGRGTAVTNASQVFANPCAEHVLAMMLAGARELPKYVLNQAGAQGWESPPERYSKETVTGKTVLVLGYGAIGRRLTELLAPFHCRVIGLRRTPRGDEGIESVTGSELATMLPLAHHVVNLLPDAVSTRKFCNAGFFQGMAPGAHFYNVGRGATVDQEALLGALRSGRVGGAWLDALDPEPLPAGHPLWSAPNCRITPHVAGGHREQDENLIRHFLANLGRFLNGEPLADRII
jgi:phosphoglycerate dehydrogenase-like enzyme